MIGIHMSPLVTHDDLLVEDELDLENLIEENAGEEDCFNLLYHYEIGSDSMAY
jgi:hypothetical protein